MSRLPNTISNQSLTFFVKGKPYSLTKGHEHFEAAKTLLLQPGAHPVQQLIEMVDQRQALLRDSHGALQVIGNDLVFRGQSLRGLWVDKIKQFRAAGEPFAPLFNALGSLLQNPTETAIERLPVFLEKSNLGFLEDGRFIAYKAVKDDYFDVHTGCTFRNMIGDTPAMDRARVDADPNSCCSTGLHVGTPEYVRTFYAHSARRVMLIAVWPHDVVSVPHSYEGTKMRICAYEVIDELDEQYAAAIIGRPVLTPRSQLPTTVTVEGSSITLKSNDGHDLRGEAEAIAAFDITTVQIGDTVNYAGGDDAGPGAYEVIDTDDSDDDEGKYLCVATATGQVWLLNSLVTSIASLAEPEDDAEVEGEHEDDGEDDTTPIGDLVQIGDVVTLSRGTGVSSWEACRAAGQYSVRGADKDMLLVEDAAGRSWVSRDRVEAATRNGVDILAEPALHAQVGDHVEIVQGGWPPAGIYPVVRVDEGREYRLIVQTEHDGEQGVLNRYVARVVR